MDVEKRKAEENSSNPSRAADSRKMRVLWIGLVLYFLLLLNAVRYVYVLPYEVVVLGALLNFAIIVTIVVSMRRVYRRLSSK